MEKFSISLSPLVQRKDFVSFLADDATVIEWNTKQQLPSDRHSIENAIILTQTHRIPLTIDPQGQAYSWILMKEKDSNLKICDIGNTKMQQTLEQCLELGIPLLLENIGELCLFEGRGIYTVANFYLLSLSLVE